MKIYKVGGAVRDSLLGIKATDTDWVVVGSSPDEMISKGFKPIGKNFPVFLHPETNEEYALARTEKKSGTGYKGFTFYYGDDVTLEDDLSRRDFTINAMAQDESGHIIDPFGGQNDLKNNLNYYQVQLGQKQQTIQKGYYYESFESNLNFHLCLHGVQLNLLP